MQRVDLVETLLATRWHWWTLLRHTDNLLCGATAFIDLLKLLTRQQFTWRHKWFTFVFGLAF